VQRQHRIYASQGSNQGSKRTREEREARRQRREAQKARPQERESTERKALLAKLRAEAEAIDLILDTNATMTGRRNVSGL